MISVIHHGDAVPKGRPRAVIVAGAPSFYTPKGTREYEKELSVSMLDAMDAGCYELLKGPVTCSIRVYLKIPKSWSRRKAAAAQMGMLRPWSRPDFDNFTKIICDAGNKILWHDDGQIVHCTIDKWYSDKPRIEIETREWVYEEGKGDDV